MKNKLLTVFILMLALFMVACRHDSSSSDSSSSSSNFTADYGGDSLKILAGSEIKVLEPLIEEFSKNTHSSLSIDYMGSLDIMKQLKTGELDYDAVWPASSILLDMGDQHHLLKHEEVTSLTPVVFGIRKSLAQDLGWDKNDVYLEDIMAAIQKDQLSFAMTSASQSNSGATAYLGFLNALNDGEQLSSEDIENQDLHDQITQILSGVERSSGSSNWLVDLFMSGQYDAMVNYEQLIIQCNEQLEAEGKESLTLVYPKDALAISDSPLAYVDHGDSEKEKLFLDFQTYILSDEGQDQIEQTGKRSAYGQVRESNQSLFQKWGIDLNQSLSPVPMPQADVIEKALQAYQTQFKKPALTLYVLDFSGSMQGEGYDQMMAALEQVLIPENAKEHYLQGTSNDITFVLPFSDQPLDAFKAEGNGQEMVDMYNHLQNFEPYGNTYLFETVAVSLNLIANEYGDNLDHYQPAVVILSDGEANGETTCKEVLNLHEELGLDIPIFSILYGSASEDDLQPLAEGTQARVFDGRDDLIQALKTVRGYN